MLWGVAACQQGAPGKLRVLNPTKVLKEVVFASVVQTRLRPALQVSGASSRCCLCLSVCNPIDLAFSGAHILANDAALNKYPRGLFTRYCFFYQEAPAKNI